LAEIDSCRPDRSLADVLDYLLADADMEGYGLAEIATELGCVPRTVQRRLRLIRHIWEREWSV